MPDTAQGKPTGRVTYAILGFGRTGYHILQEIRSEGRRIIIIDRDKDRVQELRDQGFEAVEKDIGSPSLLAGIPAIDVAFILTGDAAANAAAAKLLRERDPHVSILARASDPRQVKELEEAGSDHVLLPQQMVAKAVVHQVRTLAANRISRRLYTLLSEWEGTLGIITHSNPDPDAISSALALSAIAASANPGKLTCRIFYDGVIGRQENRTLVNLLAVSLEKLDSRALQECTYLALVDSPAPGA
ncbi:MAG: NAD-binding protein, partial [Methanoregulaceae archaeon]|nr:NAD-binding protein [Methanoregulaceae archaeon]